MRTTSTPSERVFTMVAITTTPRTIPQPPKPKPTPQDVAGARASAQSSASIVKSKIGNAVNRPSKIMPPPGRAAPGFEGASAASRQLRSGGNPSPTTSNGPRTQGMFNPNADISTANIDDLRNGQSLGEKVGNFFKDIGAGLKNIWNSIF